MLKRAATIGAEAALRYVYGNIPGKVADLENTRCPTCRRTLIDRYGYLIHGVQSDTDRRLPFVRHPNPGLWSDVFTEQRTAFPIPLRLGRV